MYEAYLITNDITGQQYVGVTKNNYKSRFTNHWWESNHYPIETQSLLHLAMLKYGIDNFHVELLEGDIPDSPETLHQEIEKKYIEQYNTFYLDSGNGYNMTRGGNGTVGYKFTADDLAKMSARQKGIPKHLTPEQLEARRERMKRENRPFKQEWKDSIRAKRLGKYTGPDNGFYGKHHTEETKQLIRERNSGLEVLQYDNKYVLIHRFFNLADAGRWIVANNLSRADYTTCANRISEVCRNSDEKCSAYGYHWRFNEEGQSTNFSLEDELPDEAQSTV